MKSTVKVIDAWDETPSIRAVKVEKPAGFAFVAGQYCFVTIGEELKHTFSIACGPSENFLMFVTRKSESEYKKAFFALKKDDEVLISGPFGEFVLGNEPHCVLLSGGIGITPFKSMIESFTTQSKEMQQKIALVYGNRSPEEIPFHKQLDEIAANDRRIRVVHIVNAGNNTWTGNVGIITAELIKKEISDWQNATYYLCGAPLMVEALKKTLAEMHIPTAQVKEESFTGYQ